MLLKDGLEVTVVAVRDGKELVLSNPFQFFNPPVGVVVDGKVAYDLTAAIEAMVAEAVRVVTR